MTTDRGTGRRERAEAYAREAAEAARRGDHRKAAALYQAAFIALERGAGEQPDELAMAGAGGDWLPPDEPIDEPN